ncbi:MAG: PilT/PilU family type 4a pilus ATPase [Oscillibacter sp.]|nr:PilT/PilU family type 4a pilus ATPase [Oscillibacter sp.]
MAELLDYLKRAVEEHASDVFIVAGGPVCAKVKSSITPLLDGERVFADKTQALISEMYRLAERPMDTFLSRHDDDFALSISGLARFRVNTYRQRGSMSAVIRLVPFQIPDWQKMHIPEEVIGLSDLTHGMVLITGEAGSGKSTTQACILDRINETRECHIVTLEDPIEYLHKNKKSIISQREIGIDSENYSSALRACLRQAPNVVLLGEMRDQETIRTAITAAETGHLLIATLHTRNAVNTIDRIIDIFPAGQQDQIRIQLSSVLQAVVSQRLLPIARDGASSDELIPACEIMKTNTAIRTYIRDHNTHQIPNAIAKGGKEGMITMDDSILALYNAGKITAQTALDFTDNPEQMERRLR